MKIKSHLDFEQIAQLLRIKVHNATTAQQPYLVKGGLYFDTTIKVLMWCDGDEWHEITDVTSFINLLVDNDGIVFSAGTGPNAGKTVVDIAANASIFEFTGTVPARILSIKDNGLNLTKLQQISKLRVLGRPDADGGDTDNVQTMPLDTEIPATAPASHDSLATTKAIQAALNAVAGDIPTISGGDGIDVSVTDVAHTVSIDATDQFEFPDGKLNIAADKITDVELRGDGATDANRAVTTAHIRDNAVSTEKIADNAVIFDKIHEDAVLTTLFEDVDNITFATTKAIVDYVTDVVSGIGNLIGGWDASSGSFPTAPDGTQKGDYWFVTTPGTTSDIEFTVGSTIIAKIDDATSAEQFIMLISKTGAATDTKLGLVRYATQAEVDNHLVDDKVVAPINLQSQLTVEGTTVKMEFGKDIKRRYSVDIGNGTATDIAVNHGFDTYDVNVEIFDKLTNKSVLVDVTRTNLNSVTIGFAVPPQENSHRVTVIA